MEKFRSLSLGINLLGRIDNDGNNFIGLSVESQRHCLTGFKFVEVGEFAAVGNRCLLADNEISGLSPLEVFLFTEIFRFAASIETISPFAETVSAMTGDMSKRASIGVKSRDRLVLKVMQAFSRVRSIVS